MWMALPGLGPQGNVTVRKSNWSYSLRLTHVWWVTIRCLYAWALGIMRWTAWMDGLMGAMWYSCTVSMQVDPCDSWQSSEEPFRNCQGSAPPWRSRPSWCPLCFCPQLSSSIRLQKSVLLSVPETSLRLPLHWTLLHLESWSPEIQMHSGPRWHPVGVLV